MPTNHQSIIDDYPRVKSKNFKLEQALEAENAAVDHWTEQHRKTAIELGHVRAENNRLSIRISALEYELGFCLAQEDCTAKEALERLEKRDSAHIWGSRLD